jgi:enediyne biosynthesis protein E4
VTPEVGDPLAKSLGVAPFDIDGDGFVDLAIANDTVRNFLFRNKGDGTFEELGIVSGMAFDQSGSVRGAMGIDWAHFRNDDALALAVANFANEMMAMYVSDAPSSFQFIDLANVYGLGAPTQPPLKFGLFFFDYDLDGRLDLLSTNGHLESDIEKTQASETYRQSAQLFWNSGRGGREFFQLVGKDVAGPDLFTPMVGRGSSYADIDGDGDLDIVMSASGEKARLFRNDGGNSNQWLRLKLVGRASNREAIGANVELQSGDLKQRRQLFPAKGYLSSVELPLTFGLGSSVKADSIVIKWPSGKTTELKDVAAGKSYTVDEEAGLVDH